MSKIVAASAFACLASLISGCIIYPVSPETHQKEFGDSLDSPSIEYLMILHPEIKGSEPELNGGIDYEFIEKVERAIAESKPNAEIVKSNSFVRTVVSDEPVDESMTVADLIARANKKARSTDKEFIEPHYLVLISGVSTSGGTGTYIPLLVGVGTTEPRTRVSVLIIDWVTGRIVHGIDSEAHAHGGGLIWIVIPFGFFPETESESASVLGALVSQKLSELKSLETIRVLVLLGDSANRIIQSETDSLLQLYYSLAAENQTDAYRWLCRSADRGNSEARYRLGQLYENANEGFAQDYIRAYMWYTLAAQSGNYWGKSNALRVKTQYLRPEAIAAAASAVEGWQPGQCESDLGLLQTR